MQKNVVTNFCKIDAIYVKVITLIFVVIVVVIIIIANVAILFCFEILVVTSWYMPMLVASETLKQDLALDLYRKQNKYISILTETHIKHD